jgi:hypothetical protein
MPHLCPLQAYAEWVTVLSKSIVSLWGPVFRKPQAGGTFEECALVCKFIACLQLNFLIRSP